MSRIISLTALAAVGICLSFNVLAQNANPCPGDKAYQVNIIGVPKDKTADMTGNNGHRIFVPLNTKDQVGRKTSIYMTGDVDNDKSNGLQCGNDFRVLDANATDDDVATLLVPCEPIDADTQDPGICFDVFATALGTPGGYADVNVFCDFEDTCDGCDIDYGSCYGGTVDFTVSRGNGGKPVTENITDVFRASGCIDADVNDELDCGQDPLDIYFSNVWIFNIEELEYYYWDYDNNGLKLMQVRFCDSAACGAVYYAGN